MRKALSILVATLALCGFAMAGEFEIEISSIPTNAVAVASGTATNDHLALLYGYIEQLWFDFEIGGTGSYTCDVDIVTAGLGPERTIFSADDLTSANDGVVYPVRDIVCTTDGSDITGVPSKIPLYQNQVVVKAYDKNVTNIVGLTVYFITTPDAAGN